MEKYYRINHIDVNNLICYSSATRYQYAMKPMV